MNSKISLQGKATTIDLSLAEIHALISDLEIQIQLAISSQADTKAVERRSLQQKSFSSEEPTS